MIHKITGESNLLLIRIQYLSMFLSLVFSFSLVAKVDINRQDDLKNELTPLGAIRVGNDGAIPSWTGEIDGFADEEPLFIITRKNFQNYKNNLTVGQQALFEHYPDSFNMPVYPTHRTAIAPDWVYENTAINAVNTTLNKDSTGFENARAGIPFPVPQSALEIYFNHVSRWRGLQLENQASDAVVYKKGRFTLFTRNSLIRFDGYLPNNTSKYFVSLISKINFFITLSDEIIRNIILNITLNIGFKASVIGNSLDTVLGTLWPESEPVICISIQLRPVPCV